MAGFLRMRSGTRAVVVTTTPAEDLAALLAQRLRLVTMMTSGVSEIEQPALGRTQYRSFEEMQIALRYLDDAIAAISGGETAAQRVRRPIYPVAREV